MVGYIVKDCWHDIRTTGFGQRPRPARGERGTTRLCPRDKTHHPVSMLGIHQSTDARSWIERIRRLTLPCDFGNNLNDLLMNRALYDQAGGRNANLPLIVEHTLSRGNRRFLNVTVRSENDVWALAAELQTDPLKIGFCGILHKQSPGRS
ncbi:hypothetical protein D3C84_833460 [compost metagenome]